MATLLSFPVNILSLEITGLAGTHALGPGVWAAESGSEVTLSTARGWGADAAGPTLVLGGAACAAELGEGPG